MATTRETIAEARNRLWSRFLIDMKIITNEKANSIAMTPTTSLNRIAEAANDVTRNPAANARRMLFDSEAEKKIKISIRSTITVSIVRCRAVSRFFNLIKDYISRRSLNIIPTSTDTPKISAMDAVITNLSGSAIDVTQRYY